MNQASATRSIRRPYTPPVSTPNLNDAWLWTARYQNKNIPPFDLVAVKITLGHPRFRLGYQIAAKLPELAPPREIFHADAATFERGYLAKLDGIGYESILETLTDLHASHGGRPLVLLCFEDIRKPEDSCHRWMFGEWMLDHGFPFAIPELEEAG